MKRLIFSLLYEDGYFVLSRNFNKQKVGDIHWLLKNYKFEDISTGIDELIILDISDKINKETFFHFVAAGDYVTICVELLYRAGGIITR